MLTLATSNPAKYEPFARELERLRVVIEPLAEDLPELQTLSFADSLAAKAHDAAAAFGRPVLVDDAGLVLDAYPRFPGPLTAPVIKSLGPAGLARLLQGVSDGAAMECHLGCWMDGALRSWSGVVRGRIDPTRIPRNPRMLLSDLFVPEVAAPAGSLFHRARALAALARDAFDLHLALAERSAHEVASCAIRVTYQCPFCAELEGDTPSIFSTMMGERLANRVVYEDDHFVVMPPLGAFMEGGLLLLSRQHILSFAHLAPSAYDHLQRLLDAIRQVSVELWGVPPLVFEHGPAPEKTKGICCVDHAHLNIFPAAVHLHPHLSERIHTRIGTLGDLARLRPAEFGYLFIQENDGSRMAYDGQDVPTQLVRRIVTQRLGRPERWHWRDYPGYEELLATYRALRGRIRL